jgi:hypothetical protein
MQQQTLTQELAHFTGTSAYYRLYPTVLLTDGTKYLADQAGCYWLMDVYASHLLTAINGEQEPFTCLQLVKTGYQALIQIDDGNGVLLAEQHIEFTDFPLDSIKLFACWENDYWVILLPSEY